MTVDEAPINSYTDYILERLELPSIAMIVATIGVYLWSGFLWSLVPCILFHWWAYYRYREFIKDRNSARFQKVVAEIQDKLNKGGYP